MNLYLLVREDWDYDQTISCVVAANSTEHARDVAENYVKDLTAEGLPGRTSRIAPVGAWLADNATCRLIGFSSGSVAGMVHENVRHG